MGARSCEYVNSAMLLVIERMNVMAEDDATKKLDALKARAAYGLGADHGMLRRMGRRCSVPAQELAEWFPDDLAAYQLAMKKENR